MSQADCRTDRVPYWLARQSQCLAALTATGIFYKILNASKLPVQGVHLFFDDTNAINGWYYFGQNKVVISGGYLKKLRGATLAVVSHELGHWVQDLEQKKGLYKLNQYTGPQREAHADWLGVRLAVRAGYSPQDWLQARALAWGCAQFSNPVASASHPAEKDRWGIVMGNLKKLKSWVRDDSQNPNAVPFASGQTPGIFNPNGSTVRHEPLTQQRTKKQCDELLAALGAWDERAWAGER